MIRRLHAIIHGKVTGVFFRANTANQAEHIGNITGFVRNKENTVEIIAEGEEKDLKQLLNWCKNGPLHAKVESLDISWKEPTGEFNNFEIRY